MAKLDSIGNHWIVIIEENIDLPYEKTTYKKGKNNSDILFSWGASGLGKYKLIQVQYSKSAYSHKDMKRILKKYDNCPLCKIGTKNLKFINRENNYKSMALKNKSLSIVNLFGKIPKLGTVITDNRSTSEEIIMQSLANISRFPMDMGLKTLWKKLLSLGIGAGGVAAVNKFMKSPNMKSEWITFFANYIANVFDPTPEQLNEMAQDINILKGAIKNRSFYGVADSMFKDPAAVKQSMENIGNAVGATRLGYKLGNIFGNASYMVQSLANKKRVRVSEGTGPAGGRGSLALKRGFHAVAQTADDFGYQDTSKRFKDVSKFGKGFQAKNRFRKSGVNQG